MKIAIVGANGQVGTELSFLLRSQGVDAVPIVRSRLGAAFLRHHDFSCRIADVSNASEAELVLRDADAVILSVIVSDVGGPSKQSRRINDAILRNAILHTRKDARVIFFSSIRAFSRRVDPSTPWWGMPYDREKRRAERLLLKLCAKEGKLGYAFRLGHVFGKNQAKTRKIQEILAGEEPVLLAVERERPSNIVHTVTIADAVLRAANTDLSPGVYSVVNAPQWTWGEVAGYYAGGRQLAFSQRKSGTDRRFVGMLQKALMSLTSFTLKHGRAVFAPVRPKLLPTSLDQYIQFRAIMQKVKSEIRQTNPAVQPSAQIPEFGYLPIPGPFIQGLTDTRDLLDSADIPDGIF